MCHDMQSRSVVATVIDDHVGLVLGWRDKLMVHGFDRGLILVGYAIYGAAAFVDITLHAAQQTDIDGGVDK